MVLPVRFLCFITAVCHVLCEVDYDTQATNYNNFLSLYNYNGHSLVDVIPLANMSATMYVTLRISLYAINDYDEIAGHIDLVTSLEMSWTDEIASARNGVSGLLYFANTEIFYIPDSTRDSLYISYDKLWTPTLVLLNSVDKITSVGGTAYRCRYNMSTGEVVWKPRTIISGACAPDVKYFPFDQQECVFTYVPWGYSADEIYLIAKDSTWDLSSFEPNGEWTISSTDTETFVANSQSHIRFRIVIERLALYFALNIVLPVGALSILNSLVFLLPPESGERVGFSTTCFLSFVVLLDIIMGMLPRSSSPISLLCYYIVVMMICSGLVTAMAILNLRVFHSQETRPVPHLLQQLVRFWTCRVKCCTRKDPDKVSVLQNDHNETVVHVGLSSTKSLDSLATNRTKSSVPRKFVANNGKISTQTKNVGSGTGERNKVKDESWWEVFLIDSSSLLSLADRHFLPSCFSYL